MTYKAFWRKPDGALVQVRLTPYGWDDAGYFVIEEAPPKGKRFKVVSEERYPGDEGACRVIEAYRQLQERFTSPGAGAATPLYCESMGLFPGDLADARAKTTQELCLDQAMLCLDLDEYEAAGNWLKQVAEDYRESSMFAQTIARRLAMNRAQEPGEDAPALRELAALHASKVIGLYQQMAAEDQYAAQRAVYHFGDDYKSAASQLVCACLTGAELLLDHYDNPEIALNYCEYGEATNYGSADLYRLKIRALLKLDRAPEAWEIFARWQHSLGDLPEITESPGYRQFVAGQNAAGAEAEQARLAAIRISYLDGPAAAEGAIDALHHRFPALGDDWPARLRDGRQAIMQVEDGELSSTYRRLAPQESLDAHAEMLDWIHLHDDNPDWPEFAVERDAILQESGIDPQQMLPIIGAPATPDCFLLRLDGGAGERGAIYQWSHEESANFEKIVDDLDEIFPYLADCAARGFHCL
ncbi:MAG: hypothetical protein WAV95_17885 [Azonexus sp.]